MGPIICDGGGQDGDVAPGEECSGGVIHLVGRLDVGASDVRVCRAQRHGAGHESHLCAAACAGLGEGKPHFAGGVVANETDRIDLLIGRPGGDQDCTPAQIAHLVECRGQYVDDALRFLHSPTAHEFAGQLSLSGLNDPVAKGA